MKQRLVKRLLAVSLVLVMAIVGVAGCGSSDTSDDASADTSEDTGDTTAEAESFTIGFPWQTTSTDLVFESIRNNIVTAIEAAGGEVITVECDLSADDTINGITELISRGVDGILFMPASDSMLETVDALCSEAGVYWGTFFRDINDEEVKETIYASEWYVGGCHEDDVVAAYEVTNAMVDMGVENLCVINIAQGDTSSDLRDEGVAEAVEETGITLLNTTYGILEVTEMTSTINGYLAAYPEMDGILIAGTYCPSALPTIEKALEDAGVDGDIIVGRIDWDTTMGEYLEAGSFHVAYGGQQQIDPLLSAVILVNAVMGAPIVEDGPCILVTNYLELTSYEDSELFVEYFLGDDAVYTAEEIQETMLKYYDSSIDQSTFEEIIENFSVASVVERHS